MTYPPSGPVLWGILGIIGGWLLLALLVEQVDRWHKRSTKKPT
jgi:predicted PurR-regulated permease PerM